ncbi:gamma-glutamyltransferase family protein [Thalassospira sp.]|uniref:gamma-glutamyltransferase family protein n=1 Tax=Thalassospira sp. TaxID=1912094 RepID=UPI0027330588|nr:gamma-glutamyltransferase [Thalassospira sp.]MDP2699631.1 gamma-glutamyltransferase [Thalassospira sp.]
MTAKGAIAAGHPVTAQAAADILAAGGNAFDAVIAALWAATVAEPVLASLGGGGFLMARPAGQPPRLYDFFAETPLAKKPAEVLEFSSCMATFSGGVTQEFHGGYGAVATPGMVAGMFAIHRDLGRMPMFDLAQPAILAARHGVTIDAFQAYVMTIIQPLLALSDESRAAFGAPGKQDKDSFSTLAEGVLHQQPQLAETITVLAQSGADGFYHGDIGKELVHACREQGGYLTADDLAAYRVLVRDPVLVAGRSGRFVLNAPPAAGGVLVGFGLKLAREMDIGDFGSLRHIDRLSQILDATGIVRQQYGASPTILSDDVCESWRSLIGERPLSQDGTTHISVVDHDGNLAAATVSNGSTSGRMIPGTGIMLNNMLGEQDLSPQGFHNWPCGVRMSSMMSPSLYLASDGRAVALGSGGSNRIRSTMLQVLLNLDVFGMSLEDAIAAPRIHAEGGILSIEPGFDQAILDRVTMENQQRWQETDMFFGGVHAAMVSDGRKSFGAAGDSRRNGCHMIVG